MKILVTGGCGFIGVNLCQLLVAEGHAVRVLDDESLGKREFLGDLPVEFIRGGITDRNVVAQSLRGVDAVVHLAADTRVMDSIEDPVKNFESNVIGSFTVLDEMRKAGVSRLVAASTGGAILGEVPCPVHEEIMPRPLSPYGASKLAMEGYQSAFAGSYGFKCASLRFSNVYGPRSYHKGSVVSAFLRSIMDGQSLTVYGDGEQLRDYVYVGDLVNGILAALKAEVSGVFQLGTGIPTSLNELIAKMRLTVSDAYPFEVHYESKRDGEIVNTYCDIGKAQREFGYRTPTSLLEGLGATWNWFLEQKKMGRPGS